MTTAFSRIHVTAVPVSDQDAALTFYTETLGMSVRFDQPLNETMRWIEVTPAPDGAASAIALVAQGPRFEAGRDTGVRLLTVDAAALHSQLSAAGVAVDELLRWPGVPPMFSFQDPDGNTLYAVEEQ